MTDTIRIGPNTYRFVELKRIGRDTVTVRGRALPWNMDHAELVAALREALEMLDPLTE